MPLRNDEIKEVNEIIESKVNEIYLAIEKDMAVLRAIVAKTDKTIQKLQSENVQPSKTKSKSD